MLGPEHSVPIGDDKLWPRLSFTRELALKSVGWAQFAGLRSSLRRISSDDGEILQEVLKEQNESRRLYPLTGRDEQLLSERKTVTSVDRRASHAIKVQHPAVGDSMAWPWCRVSDRSAMHHLSLSSTMAFR